LTSQNDPEEKRDPLGTSSVQGYVEALEN